MRKIQTEIRHDRIENDNRKNELQSKAQGGLKTANKTTGNEKPVQNNTVNQPQAVNNPTQTAEKPPQASSIPPQISIYAEKPPLERLKADTMLDSNVQQANAVIKAAHGIETAASGNGEYTQIQADQNKIQAHENFNSFEAFDSQTTQTAAFNKISKSDTKAQITHQLTAAEMGIQNGVKHDGIENTIKRDVIQNKSEIGIRTTVNKVKDIKEDKISIIKKNARLEFANKGIPKAQIAQSANETGSPSQIKHDGIENTVKRDIIQNKAEIGIKTAVNLEKGSPVKLNKKGDNFPRIKNNTQAKIADTFKMGAAASLTLGTSALKALQSSTPSGGDNLSSESASKVKEAAENTVDKSFNAIKEFAQKKAKSVRASMAVSRNQTHVNATNIQSSENFQNISKATGTAIKGVSSAVGTVQNFKSVQSDNDISSDMAKQTENYTEKALNKGFENIKEIKDKTTDIVRHFKNTKNDFHYIENTKKAITNGSGRTVKNAVKPVQGASRTIQKATKTSIKTASKTTIKTSAKTAKATAKTAKTAAKVTAEAAKAAAKLSARAAQISAKAAASLAQAVGALMSNPVGWIILAVIVVVIIVIIIISSVSSSSINTVNAVGGAVVSPLSWIFNDSTSSSPNVSEIYLENEEKAKEAMEDAKSRYKNEISGISFGERDSIVFNGASFYPASAADDFIQSYFDGLDYDDYVYLCQICYIKKLRDERAAQGLSENDMPEITITRTDIYNFLVDYCYDFNITIEHGQTCPTMDCQEEESTYYHGESCPDVDDGGTCPGHTYTHHYCNHSHIKAIITIQQIPKDVLENLILMLTEEEKTMLDLGIQLINEFIEP